MKMIVKHIDFFTLFNELGGYKKGQLKLKKPKDLQVIFYLYCELFLFVIFRGYLILRVNY